MRITMSILGLWEFDNSIFDLLTLPSALDKEVLIENLLQECAEFECLYTSPQFMKASIGAWSKKQQRVWQKLYETTMFEYNPIHNYDRKEKWTDTETRNLNGTSNQTRDLKEGNVLDRTLDETDKHTRDLSTSNLETRDLKNGSLETRDLTLTGDTTSDNDSTTTYDVDSNVQHSVAGFNEAPLVLASTDKTTALNTDAVTGGVTTHTVTDDVGTITKAGTDTGTITQSGTDTGTIDDIKKDVENVTGNKTDTGTVNHETSDTGTVDNVRTGEAAGNIGVTTTQQMIAAEREIVQFNMYDFIITDFKERYCLLLY